MNQLTNTKIIDDCSQAARALKDGLLVAFATETVYGLGADATNPRAIQRLFLAKGRPSDNPLIVHLSHSDQLTQAALCVPDSAKILLDHFSPGPLTVVVEKHPQINDLVTAGLKTVGIRIPDHPQATELLRLANRPIAAPSANLSGRPSCTTWQSVAEDLQGKIDYILKGGVSRIGIESTVVDCTGEQPVLLRAGAVSLEQIRSLLPQTIPWQGLPRDSGLAITISLPSPGLRHPHYQPKAHVHLVNSMVEAMQLSKEDPSSCAFVGLMRQCTKRQTSCQKDAERVVGGEFGFLVEFETISEYARHFYETLREADRRKMRHIFLQLVGEDTLGTALRDRQFRAAGVVQFGN